MTARVRRLSRRTPFEHPAEPGPDPVVHRLGRDACGRHRRAQRLPPPGRRGRPRYRRADRGPRRAPQAPARPPSRIRAPRTPRRSPRRIERDRRKAMLDRERDLGGGDRRHRPGHASDPRCGRCADNLRLRRDQPGGPPICDERRLEALRPDREQPFAAILPDQPARLRERLAVEHVQKDDLGPGAQCARESGIRLAVASWRRSRSDRSFWWSAWPGAGRGWRRPSA